MSVLPVDQENVDEHSSEGYQISDKENNILSNDDKNASSKIFRLNEV